MLYFIWKNKGVYMGTIGTNHAVNSQYHLNINRAISLENAKRYEDAKAFYK